MKRTLMRKVLLRKKKTFVEGKLNCEIFVERTFDEKNFDEKSFVEEKTEL